MPSKRKNGLPISTILILIFIITIMIAMVELARGVPRVGKIPKPSPKPKPKPSSWRIQLPSVRPATSKPIKRGGSIESSLGDVYGNKRAKSDSAQVSGNDGNSDLLELLVILGWIGLLLVIIIGILTIAFQWMICAGVIKCGGNKPRRSGSNGDI